MAKERKKPVCRKCGEDYFPRHKCGEPKPVNPMADELLKDSLNETDAIGEFAKAGNPHVEEESKLFCTENYLEAETLQVKHGVIPVAVTGDPMKGTVRKYSFSISEASAKELLNKP